MDWPTIIITSLLSSSIVASGVVVLLKKTFEKGIETKFKEIENRQRINLEESMRRDAKLFDDQYDISKSINALVYRVRNCSREIAVELDKENYNIKFLINHLQTLIEYQDSLDRLLFDNKAILPEAIFKELHDLKHALYRLRENLNYLYKVNKPSDGKRDEIIGRINKNYTLIDMHYSVLTGLIHTEIGLNK